MGLLNLGPQCTVTPKAAEVLSGSKVRLGGCGDAMVVGIKVKVQRKIRVFEILCQIIASPLPECIIGMDIMSGDCFPYLIL